MSDSHVNVSKIDCQLSNLTVLAANAKPTSSATVLKNDKPFSLHVTVEFSGPGAIALMPFALSVQVEFYAKPLGPKAGIILGTMAISTSPEILIYTPKLTLGPPSSVGLEPKTLYRIGAVLRVGAPDWPSLIHGFTEELTLEIYGSPGKTGQGRI
jgi:hypothetical protein